MAHAQRPFHRRLSVLLLLLLLLLLCAAVALVAASADTATTSSSASNDNNNNDDDDDGGDDEVLHLNADTFYDAVTEEQAILVDFYVPCASSPPAPPTRCVSPA